MKRTSRDLALWFFGIAALACLLVSLPATAKAMQLFHGSEGGIVATLVFEIGAVGAELATLAVPQWRKRLMLLTITLLVLTTGGNYALGVDHFGTAQDIGTTYATIRAAGAGWLLAIMSSAIFPALLFVFLTAFTARYRMVRGGYDTPAGALAFWVSSYGQWLTMRVNTAEQAMSSLEQSVNTFEQQAILARAANEQMRADYEQRLVQATSQHEQELIGWRQRLNTSDQALNLLRIELNTAEQAQAQTMNTLEQRNILHEQVVSGLKRELAQDVQELVSLRCDLSSRDQQVNDLLGELNSRPTPMEVEVITIARKQYTYEQLAQHFDTSVSTVRRRLTQQEVLEG